MKYSVSSREKSVTRDFIKWFRREYWSLGGVEYLFEKNQEGDFKNPWVDIAFRAYVEGLSCKKKDRIIKSLSNELQTIIDAADGKGWEQLDPSFKSAREVLQLLKETK